MTTEFALIDSNVLVRAYQTDHPHHAAAGKLVASIALGQRSGAVAHQNLLELYRTVTDPKKMSQPASHEAVSRVLSSYLNSRFKVIIPTAETFRILVELQKRSPFASRGLKIFDWYLAATMLAHGITTILTENTKDFVKIPGITAINPFVASGKID